MRYWLSINVIVLLSINTSLGQMLSNQGTLISVKNDAVVSVHGDVLNDNNGTFDNSNEIHVHGNVENNGNGTFYNSKTIYVDGDWENNANNEAFTSTTVGEVILLGDDQTIKGSSITRFFDLKLENTGIKYATIDAYINGTLYLNDREFNADTNTIHVFNTDLNAIMHTQGSPYWGMVSNDGNGGLLRHTLNDQAYFYPIGSSLNGIQFRPINIKPNTTAAAAYKARLADIDATIDGFDRDLLSPELCNINPHFYHRIAQTAGTQGATLDFFYDAVADGNYSNIAHWDSNLWENASTGTNAIDTTYNLTVLTGTSVVTNFTPNPFALAKPGIVAQVSADTVITVGTTAELSASGGDFYTWTPAQDLSCDICDNTIASPLETTTFIVNIENIEGCIVVDTVLVEVEPVTEVLVPNVLTPNNDGKNDTWYIKNIDLFDTRSVKIVNRWGDIVFEAKVYQNNFNGEFAGGKLPAGTYYYILDLGEDLGIHKGPVTIIRE
ncbi:MAG: gliding motility-associated C-terminal domain-containing protein [Aureispira sp.]|nr:gliding motility-associated C-terminal domain-containing protein [Aureispira sp.]